MSLVRFGSKNAVRSDIIVIYYSYNGKYYSDSGWYDFDITDVAYNSDNK